jgi:hypothetical protein
MPFEDITFASATSAQQSSKEKNSDAQRPNMHQRLAPKQSLKNEKAAGQTHRVQVAHTHIYQSFPHTITLELCASLLHLCNN